MLYVLEAFLTSGVVVGCHASLHVASQQCGYLASVSDIPKMCGMCIYYDNKISEVLITARIVISPGQLSITAQDEHILYSCLF